MSQPCATPSPPPQLSPPIFRNSLTCAPHPHGEGEKGGDWGKQFLQLSLDFFHLECTHSRLYTECVHCMYTLSMWPINASVTYTDPVISKVYLSFTWLFSHIRRCNQLILRKKYERCQLLELSGTIHPWLKEPHFQISKQSTQILCYSLRGNWTRKDMNFEGFQDLMRRIARNWYERAKVEVRLLLFLISKIYVYLRRNILYYKE
jgi:hypothetical protein